MSATKGACQTYSTYPSAPFAFYTWTQNNTGIFDIYALFDSPSTPLSWRTFIVLYNASIPWQQLQNPCNKSGIGLKVIAGAGYIPATGAALFYQMLSVGNTYTLAFSGYGPTQVGYYGIRIIPTQIRFPSQVPYVQPQRGISECYSDPYNDASSWDAFLFNAKYERYLIDTGDIALAPFTSFDTYSFLYQGNNVGNSTQAPAGCPYFAQLLTQADTGEAPLVQLTTIGTNYSVVVSTYSGKQTGTTTKYAYLLYLFAGDLIPDDQPPFSTAPMATTPPFFLVPALCLLFFL